MSVVRRSSDSELKKHCKEPSEQSRSTHCTMRVFQLTNRSLAGVIVANATILENQILNLTETQAQVEITADNTQLLVDQAEMVVEEVRLLNLTKIMLIMALLG